jgi:GMP synthase (glutamine-hydrolysing)
VFQRTLGVELLAVDAVQIHGRLVRVTDPETKRRIIGELFIRTFETQARGLVKRTWQGIPRFLVQSTICPCG